MSKRILLWGLGTIFLALLPALAQGDPATAAKIAALEAELRTLESIVTNPEGGIQTAILDVAKLKTIKVSGYVQARKELDESGWDVSGGNLVGTSKHSFYVKRARIKLEGTGDNTSGVIQIDVAGTEGKIGIKDAFVCYAPVANDVTKGGGTYFGQFGSPFSYQVMRSSAVRETPEWAAVTKALCDDFEYAQGVKYVSKEGKTKYAVALINGTKGSALDNNEDKDIAARVNHAPNVTTDMGFSYYTGLTFAPPVAPATSGTETARTRMGFDIQKYLDGTAIQFEYLSGQDGSKTKSGWYTQVKRELNAQNSMVVMYDTYNNVGVVATQWNVGWLNSLDNISTLKFFYNIKPNDGKKSNVSTIEWVTRI